LLSSPKKILFIEPANHYEVLRVYVLMFRSFGYHADIMSTQRNINQIKGVLPIDCKIFIIDRSIEINNYLLAQSSTINDYNMVILTTDEDVNSMPLKKNWDSPTFLLIHHFRSIFDYKNNIQLFNHYLDPLRYIKNLLQNKYSKRASFAKTFDGYLFPYEVGDKDKSKIFDKPKVVLPFLFNEFSDNSIKPTKSIVIPGTIDNASRNYSIVIQALKEIKNLIEEPIEIVLLGKYNKRSGQGIIARFKQITDQNIKLIYFEKEIDQSIFDKYMKHASALLLPLNVYFTHSLIGSIGGKYSVSGSIGDMVRFGKKALITEDYALPHFLEKHAIRFNTENLAEKIIQVLAEKPIEEDTPYFNNNELTYFKNQIKLLLEYGK
jgi:hypothetical protein